MADIFRAKIVDVEKDSLMVELTGNGSKVECRFWNFLEGYEILELAKNRYYRIAERNQGCNSH